MAYTPPDGNKAALNFTGGPYTPPTGDDVALNFGVAIAPGTVYPGGWDSSTFGSTQITPKWLTPSGWFAGAYGTPSIANRARVLLPGGIAPPPSTGTNEFRQIPSPWISFWTRYLNLDSPTHRGIAPPTWTNTHNIGYEIRIIDHAGRGSNTMVLGTPRIEYSSRTVYPNFISSMVFGTPNVARIQVIAPTNWESSAVATGAQLDINLQRLFASGVAQGGYGDPTVRNQWEYLYPQGVAPVGYGFPVVYNLKQSVEVGPFRGNDPPEYWPTYSPFVENVTRYVGAQGWQSSRFSLIGNLVENGARALYPTGWDSFYWNPGNFIAHYTRCIAYEGWDSFYSSSYHAVYNGARVLQASGWASSRVGIPSEVLNLNRTVIHHSGPSDGFYGTPFIADANRNLRPGLFYDLYFPIPEVRLNPHPLAPAGIPMPSPTAPWVYEHFNILGPRSVNVHSVPWVGEPFIRNRNRALFVGPTDQSLYGTPRIINADVYLTIGLGDTAQYGATLVEHRTKTLRPSPISVPTFATVHQIRNLLPDPPYQQLIVVPSVNINGNGTAGFVSEPDVYARGIWPTSISQWGFGAITVRGNGIFPSSINEEDKYGYPLVGGTQYAYPPSIPRSIQLTPGQPEPETYGDSDDYWTKNHSPGYEWPRLTPHMIYAPQGDGKTAQAVVNNPPSPEPNYHVIDGLMAAGYDSSRHPFFGNTWISLKHRIIGPVPLHGGQVDHLDPSSVVGDGAVVDLRLRYVFPEGIRSQRFGRAVFLDVPQYVYLVDDEGGIRPGDWYDLDPPGSTPPRPPSIHTVAYAPLLHRPVYPTGFTGAVGTHNIELFNREVSPQGIPHRGNPQQGLTSPWGTPLVGYPRTYSWGGYDMARYGTAWFSHYTREVYPEGWNSDSLESNDIINFDDRMRVRLYNHPRTVIAGNIAAPTIPPPTIMHFNRTITGRGFAAGAISAPRVTMVIFPDGWDSSEYGDIDEWEAGKIKAHGDDMSYVGIPKLLHPLGPSGIAPGDSGVPSFVRALYPSGIPVIGFDGPSLTDIYGCSVRVVAPLPVLSLAVPTPQVAHV